MVSWVISKEGAPNGIPGLIFIFVFFGWVLSGCQAENAPAIYTATMTATIEPTSIILVYRSPVPSAASTPMSTLTPTPDPGANDPSEYYGGLVITLDHVGKTLTMRRQGGFLLRLGEEYNWSVTVHPPDILTQNRKISLSPGEQGVFLARQKGSAVLRAVGKPVCLAFDPPCLRPAVLFEMYVLIE